MSYKKILGCVPVYHSMEPEPLLHFMMLAQEAGRAEQRQEYGIRWMVGGPKVRTSSVRNQAAYATIDYGADYLLMIDDDMIMAPKIVATLLSRDLGIIVPLFFRASAPIEPLVYDMDEVGNPVPILNYPRNSLFECPGGAGTGMMLVKTEVLKAVQETGPIFKAGGDEDVDFCARARKLGYRTWCDSSVSIYQMGIPRAVGEADYKHPAKRSLWEAPSKSKIIEYTLDDACSDKTVAAPGSFLSNVGHKQQGLTALG